MQLNRILNIPHRIAIIGGSNVYGQGDPIGGGFVGRFRGWFEPLNDRNRVFNLGVGGDTVEKMLCRASAEVKARRAELILCYPGFNNIQRIGSSSAPHSDLKLFKEQLKELITELSDIAPTILMTAIPLNESRTLPFRDDMFFLEADAEEIMKIVQSVATELNIACFDIFKSWIKRSDCKEFLTDGLHCNPKGHSLLAEELKEFLIGEFKK